MASNSNQLVGFYCESRKKFFYTHDPELYAKARQLITQTSPLLSTINDPLSPNMPQTPCENAEG